MTEVIKIKDAENLIPTSEYPHASWEFKEFNPVQSCLIDYYEGDSNIAIAASTSAGKTASAEIYMSYEIRKNKGKAIYIGPLKALAKEKELTWRSKNHHFSNLKISICTGDYGITPSRVKELDESDIIVMTPEMLSSRCRNHKSEKSNFLKDVNVVVFDESHLITVPRRGDHIEVALMKLVEINPNIRIVFLSATMPNVDEICGWLSKITERTTYYLESDYRPCPLNIYYESYYDEDRRYSDRECQKVGTALAILEHYPEDKFLVFVHTKATGRLMIQSLKKHNIDAEFHSADLGLAKRMELEDKFRNDPNFRVLVSTSTLAWGIDAPARRVIIVGVHRGLTEVESYDIQQMAGRAGRPSYDPRGDVYILVPQSDKREVIDRLKKKSKIKSRLLEQLGGRYKTLAFHVVSEIYHGNIKTQEAFEDWFSNSLASYQNQLFDGDVVNGVIDALSQCRAIVLGKDGYEATAVGKIASMFYYSPFDVADLKSNFYWLFKNSSEYNDHSASMAIADIDTYKWGICSNQEKTEMTRYHAEIDNIYGQGRFKNSVIKTGFAYYSLLKGRSSPVFSALQNTLQFDFDRTNQVLSALDSMSGKWGKKSYFNILRLRIKYGVRAELVNLCLIPNVGKARAERLWKAGIKNSSDFISTDVGKLAKVMKVSLKIAEETFRESLLI